MRRVAVPFVYTPGDNEWTDCHRPAAGRYLPTERLQEVRRLFFPYPGYTGGRQAMPVTTQASVPSFAPYVENVRFVRSEVVWATVHVVGSNNDLEPSSGLVGGDQPEARLAEFTRRRQAATAWISSTFEHARWFGKPVLLIHGDEHVYEVEPNYGGVPNLTRLETYGDTATRWLKLTVDPRTPQVFSWTPQGG